MMCYCVQGYFTSFFCFRGVCSVQGGDKVPTFMSAFSVFSFILKCVRSKGDYYIICFIFLVLCYCAALLLQLFYKSSVNRLILFGTIYVFLTVHKGTIDWIIYIKVLFYPNAMNKWLLKFLFLQAFDCA